MAIWFALFTVLLIIGLLLLALSYDEALERKRRPAPPRPDRPGTHDHLVYHWEAPGSRPDLRA